VLGALPHCLRIRNMGMKPVFPGLTPPPLYDVFGSVLAMDGFFGMVLVWHAEHNEASEVSLLLSAATTSRCMGLCVNMII